MKHLIIFNNAAGEGKAKEYLPNVEYSFEGLDYEIHLTQRPGEATTFLKEYLSTHKEPVRVYACGGDGTIYECVNGIYGHPNVELAVYAIGTGNDFVKVYGGKEKFNDLVKLIKGTAVEVDLTKIKSDHSTTPYYSINVVNFGFDAVVGAVGNKYKIQGKKDPYSKALLPAILTARFNKINVYVDGEKISKKKMLLCTLAQGQFVGGKFWCAPRSKNDDGLIDICLLHTMSLFGFLGILTPYTNGQHFDLKKYEKKVVYRQAKQVVVNSEKEFDVCVDGEMIRGKHFEAEILPKALKFVVPAE